MIRITLRIDKGEHVYIPKHKQWVQMFKQLPKADALPVEGEEPIKVTEWEYEAKQIDYNKEWGEEIEIIEGEEVLLTAEQYLYKHFDEVWDNN